MQRRAFAEVGLLMIGMAVVGRAVGGAMRADHEAGPGQFVVAPTYEPADLHDHKELMDQQDRINITVAPVTGAYAIYVQNGFVDRNGGQPGQVSEPVYFASLEAAMAAERPLSAALIRVTTNNQVYVWEPRFSWCLYPTVNTAA
jgi:hypothetical protein